MKETTNFSPEARERALHVRKPFGPGSLVHHGGRGSQYASIRYTGRLVEAGVEPSVGSVGDSMTTPLPKPSTGCTRPR